MLQNENLTSKVSLKTNLSDLVLNWYNRYS